jgi:hypothetical protein
MTWAAAYPPVPRVVGGPSPYSGLQLAVRHNEFP